jgi:lysophospholipase L1-like esterase
MKKLWLLMVGLLAFSLTGCKKNDEWEQLLEEYRTNKMAIYEEENEMYADYEVDVAFIGDSLTDGYDVKRFYSDYLVSNRGIAADTTFDLENRLEVSIYDLKPKIVVMLIGANNFKTMFDNYEEILVGYKTNLPNTRVILLSLTPMSMEWGKNNNIAKNNNIIIKSLAEKYSFEYVDLYNALLNEETGEIYEEYTIDGGHLTEAGYVVLTNEITPVLEVELNLWNKDNE